jgi:hypothetical protein
MDMRAPTERKYAWMPATNLKGILFNSIIMSPPVFRSRARMSLRWGAAEAEGLPI